MKSAAAAKPQITAPHIESVRAKIGTIERRIEYLRRKLARPEYADTASAEFDRSEIPALEAAVLALKYCEIVN